MRTTYEVSPGAVRIEGIGFEYGFHVKVWYGYWIYFYRLRDFFAFLRIRMSEL